MLRVHRRRLHRAVDSEARVGCHKVGDGPSGATDVNVAELSMRRADGAMGRNKMTQKEDCVHYCMPGVPDSLARLVFNALINEPPLDGSSRPSSSTAAPEWESLPGMPSLTEWLSQRGVSKAFDPAIGLYHSDQADIERVDAQPW